ncbi:uncharacterized protein LOC115970244 [Quercus lobata]|uniref:uncharacterized protein LOC115970244 n=1 Tax=Quercus lobata TaxID=97700 RepID=UPI0012462479|nr:uncharacterized protein LOC115970244 [Quercus lobata]
MVFREPVRHVLEKIKNELYFKWSNKMGGDPIRRNQSLHWLGAQGNASLRPPLGTINVIIAAPGRTSSRPSSMMSVARLPAKDSKPKPKGVRVENRPAMSFFEEDKEPLSWRVHIDGAANQRGFGVGLVLISPEKITIEKSMRLGFSATNNEAEYEALLVGMAMVQKIGGKTVKIFSNSRLVVGQVRRELEARDVRMQEYLNQVRHLQSRFESFSLLHIRRGENTHADSLTTLATSST